MTGPSFRDRFYSPPVARAITAPSGIVLFIAVGVVAILVGLPLAAALVIGLTAWLGKLLLAVPRTPRSERIDPFGVNEPWRRFVQDVLQARNRFADVVHRTRSGPLHDNLRQTAQHIDEAVQECWQIAKRGQLLTQARRGIDLVGIERRLADLSSGEVTDPTTIRVIASLEAQRDTATRLDQVIAGAQADLRMMDARLEETVVRGIELSAQAASEAALTGLGTDVENLVTEMEALRQAMDETSRAAHPELGSGADEE